MKSKLFTFLFIALAGLSFGLPPSAKEIEQYTSASFMYMDIKDYKSALVMARKAVAISSGTPLTFVMANARAVLGVAYMKDNPIATPGIENNIEQAIRYYQSIGKKNDLDKFIIKNLELVLENARTESPTEELIKIPNLLIDSLMLRRFSDPYFDIQNGFKLEHNSELVYVAKKMAFASQLSRNTLILPQDLSDQLGEKALRISKNLQDRELIARTTANVGAVYSKDSRNILTSTFQLNDAIETFDDLQISTPEIAPIEQLLQPQAKSNTLFKKQLGARTYASIEIGSGGVKLAILQYRRNQSKEIIFDVVEKPKSEDTKFTDFVEPNLRQTIRKVVEYHKYVSDPNGTHALSPRQIFITVSSGVIRSIGNDLKRLEMLTALREGIIRESGHPEVAILEEADEPKLTLLGVLPEESRQNKNDELYRHVLIDIGTGNTKGGYFGRDKDQKLFSYFTSSWGLRRLEEKLKSFPIEQVEKAAAQLVDSVMRNEIIGMLGASSIQNKSDVILTILR
jgi:tetratricopeptide (TPR) repeat protein